MKRTPGAGKAIAWTAFFFIMLMVDFVGAAPTDGIANSSRSELKVALLDFGPIGDHGWTYEAHVGADKTARQMPYLNLSERESASGPDAPQIMRDYAKNGYKLILCHSYSFGDAIREVASEYPDTIFMWGGGTEKLAPNAGIYFARIYEVQYLAGIVAGNMTKTDEIGYVAALPTSDVVIGIDSFAKGVASCNPRAKIYVEWVGNWYDPEKEKAAALSLIKRGCDVITHHSDSDATGEAAERMGTYFISFGSNTARFTPDVFLTGVVWNWEPIMTDVVEAVHNGTWAAHPGQDWWYGLKEGAVKLAPFSDLVPADLRRLVEEQQKAIVQGELVIFPGQSDEDLRAIYYFEPNVVGDLP